MIVVALDGAEASPHAVTSGGLYRVYALSVERGATQLLVVDDERVPRFVPASGFEAVQGAAPEDWRAKLALTDDVELAIGPSLVVETPADYAAMRAADPAAVARFFRRIEFGEAGEPWPAVPD